jgi:hypothetical protein
MLRGRMRSASHDMLSLLKHCIRALLANVIFIEAFQAHSTNVTER